MPADTKVKPLEFDIADFLGNRPALGASNIVTLRRGEKCSFITANGEQAVFDIQELKMNGVRAVNSDRNTTEIINLAIEFFASGTLTGSGETHPYFMLPGIAELPKRIYTQNWRTSLTSAQELVQYLRTLGWRYNPNPSVRQGQQAGHLFTCNPPTPPVDADGKPDFTNYGLAVDQIVLGSTYDEEANDNGFRDFATELKGTYDKVVQVSEIVDDAARAEAKKDMSRAILSLTGRKSDGFPRTAQINSLQIGARVFDLWNATNVEVDLLSLVQNRMEAKPALALDDEDEPF